MKSYQLKFTEAAKQDIDSMNHYLNHNFGEQKAKKALGSLKNSILRLSEMPNLGRDAKDLSKWLVGYRFLHLPKNTVFFQFRDESVIVVLRVYDNRREILANLLSYLDQEEE